MENICELIILKYTSNSIVSTSAFFNRIFTRIGFFENPVNLINKMKLEGLLKDEGYFNETSGILKNIQITEKGKETLEKKMKNLDINTSIELEKQKLVRKILDLE